MKITKKDNYMMGMRKRDLNVNRSRLRRIDDDSFRLIEIEVYIPFTGFTVSIRHLKKFNKHEEQRRYERRLKKRDII